MSSLHYYRGSVFAASARLVSLASRRQWHQKKKKKTVPLPPLSPSPYSGATWNCLKRWAVIKYCRADIMTGKIKERKKKKKGQTISRLMMPLPTQLPTPPPSLTFQIKTTRPPLESRTVTTSPWSLVVIWRSHTQYQQYHQLSFSPRTMKSDSISDTFYWEIMALPSRPIQQSLFSVHKRATGSLPDKYLFNHYNYSVTVNPRWSFNFESCDA